MNRNDVHFERGGLRLRDLRGERSSRQFGLGDSGDERLEFEVDEQIVGLLPGLLRRFVVRFRQLRRGVADDSRQPFCKFRLLDVRLKRVFRFRRRHFRDIFDEVFKRIPLL